MTTRKQRWTSTLCFAGLLMATALLHAQKGDAPDILLQRGIQKEMVEGDLKGAIELFRNVLKARGVTQRVAADALLHMAASYEKMGDAEAQKLYEQVVRDYSSQIEAVAEAQKRLASSGKQQTEFTPRLICGTCDVNEVSISADGRFMVYPDGGEIAIRNLQTKQVTRLMLNSGSSKSPDARPETPLMSPDLRYIAYTSLSGRERQLLVASPEAGTSPITLINNLEYGVLKPVAWSLDSKSVLTILEKRWDRIWQLAWVTLNDHSIKVISSSQWRIQYASLSPDGRYVAYSAYTGIESRQTHIHVVPSNGSASEVALVKGSSQNESPVWTADGSHVLFTSDRAGAGTYGLWSIKVQSGRVAGFPEFVRDTGRILGIGMSRTGSFYYTTRPQAGFDQVFIGEVRKSSTPLEGNSLQAAGDATLGGQQPFWSPDGKFVQFAKPKSGATTAFDIVVRTVQTGEERSYPQEGYAAGFGVRWLQDSKGFIAWGSDPAARASARRVLYRVDVDTREWKPLLTLDHSRMAPAWGISPDEQTLYKGARDPKDPQLTTNRPFSRILVIDFKTGVQKDVLSLPEAAWSFTLSPDGRTFAIMSQPDAQKQQFFLSRMSVDGTGYRRLTEPSGTVPYVKWTSDSRTLLFVEADGPDVSPIPPRAKIMRMPAEGGKREFTGMAVTALTGFDLSADGSKIAFTATTGAKPGELWSLDNINSLLKDSQ